MRSLVPCLLALVALPALAHPGEHHAALLSTLWHLFSEPDHLALIGIVLLVGIGAARIAQRRTAQGRKSDDSR